MFLISVLFGALRAYLPSDEMTDKSVISLVRASEDIAIPTCCGTETMLQRASFAVSSSP